MYFFILQQTNKCAFRPRSIDVSYVSIVKTFCVNWLPFPKIILSFPILPLPYKYFSRKIQPQQRVSASTRHAQACYIFCSKFGNHV